MSVYILAGDSIMYGSWDPDGGWPGKLRNFFDLRALGHDPVSLNTSKYVALYNLGIPGDTSRGLLKRFSKEVKPRLNSQQKNIILLGIGTNDAQLDKVTNMFQVPIAETEDNMHQLIASAKELSDAVVVVGLPPVDEAKTDPLYWEEGKHYVNSQIQKYNDLIKSVAEKENVPFIDINRAVAEHDVSVLMEDGIHPSAYGHQVMYEEIRDFLLSQQLA